MKTQSQESIVVSELSVSVFVFVLFCCLSLFLKNHVRHLSTQSSHTSQSWYWVLLGAQKHLFVYLFNFFLSLSSFPSIFLPFFPLLPMFRCLNPRPHSYTAKCYYWVTSALISKTLRNLIQESEDFFCCAFGGSHCPWNSRKKQRTRISHTSEFSAKAALTKGQEVSILLPVHALISCLVSSFQKPLSVRRPGFGTKFHQPIHSKPVVHSFTAWAPI